MAATPEFTYTITFGDCAENRVGMQQIGSKASTGFTIEDLYRIKAKFEQEGVICQLEILDPFPYVGKKAAVLVIRGGANLLSNADEMLKEQMKIKYDTQYRDTRFGGIKNNRARYNVCFADEAQEMNLDEAKGTIYSFDSLPWLNMFRQMLPEFFGEKAEGLYAEGNLYPDITKCGIGYHTDKERTKVAAVRLGATMVLCFAFFYQGKVYGDSLRIILEHGDAYCMSEEAVGVQRRNGMTLKHAAGAEKYVSLDKY